jgi:ankyrin repeat protein
MTCATVGVSLGLFFGCQSAVLYERGGAKMRTQRKSKWLLIALLSLVVVYPGGTGRAAADSPLVEAARDGDLQAVRALLVKRANVNEPSRDGSTPLLWAAYHGNLDMAKALIAAGANVNTANRYGITPLLQASRTGDTPMIQALLTAGANVSLAHPDGETPLMAAARAGRVDAVKLLAAKGADVNAADKYQQQTALMWAAAEGHTDVINTLIEAGANPNVKAAVTSLEKREHADHPTGGFTPLMFAVRNGHEEAVRALVKGGADLKLTNGDGATASVIAIVNDRFDLAATLLELGADPNDGQLYFAVDMHDATTDMRARDGSRLRADYPNKLNALDLVRLLLDKGADANKPFVGQLHSTSLCCGDNANGSAFFRAAIASDVEALKLMIAKGAQVEWTPTEVKGEGRGGGGGRGANANVGKTPVMVAMVGGKGAGLAGGPGFTRIGPPPFREESNREPLDAVKVLLAAGANPNAKAPDGSAPLHQAVAARQVPIIRALVEAGADLNAVNKENLTPLLLAEKPEKKPEPGNNNDPDTYKPKQNSREEVIAALRELMKLGPDDPAPQPPPLPPSAEPTKDEKKDEAAPQNDQNN